MARVEIYTNTQRSRRRWEEMLADGRAAFLPKIHVIPDLGRDPSLGLAFDAEENMISQQLLIMQAVRKLLESSYSLAPNSAAFDMAGSLLEVFGEMEAQGIPLSRIGELEIEGHSEHWRRAQAFLNILEASDLTKGALASGTEAAQNLAVETLVQRWLVTPPRNPVIVAGSTGSRPATARLMKAVTQLSQGAVVLPGFDFELPEDVYDALRASTDSAVDHPQFGFAELLEKFGLTHEDVAPWAATQPVAPQRNRLVSLAMRPAPVTDKWLEEGPRLVHELELASDRVSWLEAPDARMEAAAIAMALRDAVEHNKRAVLITPDATLSRRVTAELGRWAVIPDDSKGVPLQFTPPATFLSLVGRMRDQDCATLGLVELLKHPLCHAGCGRGIHLEFARNLDARVLRRMGPQVDWGKIEAWAENDKARQAWVKWLKDAITSLGLPRQGLLSLYKKRHIALAEALVAGSHAEGSPLPLWEKNAGLKAAAALGQLDGLDDYAGALSYYDYVSVFSSVLGQEHVQEDGFVPDKRISIWGQLEARVEGADFVVLGGLNEGIWPKLPAPDPWLSRSMRATLGLPLPERRIGLSSHDFQQAMANNEVLLSRALKVDNTPSVASRWLIRLENLMVGLGREGEAALKEMKQRGNRFAAWVSGFDASHPKVQPERRPCPAPPVGARPSTISVTQVEKLIRDPYSIYADKVLNLRPLDSLGRAADPRDRGNALHAVMEQAIRVLPEEQLREASAQFLQIAEKVLDEKVPWPAERRLWLGRLERIADGFLAREKERRAIAQPKVFEIKGAVQIPGFPRDLILSCRADRIDMAADGDIAIYDYKSSAPSDKQAREFSKQLELEAKIAILGGFEGMPRAHAKHLEIIGLSKAEDFVEFDSDTSVIGAVWDDFLKLIAHFETAGNGYSARLRPVPRVDWSDYDHLARRGEWDDNDELNVETLK